MTPSTTLKVSFRDITKDNIEQLKVLNNTIFPIRYTQQFYNDIVAAAQYAPVTRIPVKSGAVVSQIAVPADVDSVKGVALTHQSVLCRYAFYNDYVIGAVACKLEHNAETKRYNVYIMTLCVLAPYRSQNVGTQLLQYVLDYCGKHADVIESITAHVQTNNEDAIRFYKRHGFSVDPTVIDNYYKRITPSSAYLIKCSVTGTSSDEKKEA